MGSRPKTLAPTATPGSCKEEEGCIRIPPGSTLEYDAVDEDGRCYVDIPACGPGACPVEWGREVSCDDWETTVPESEVTGTISIMGTFGTCQQAPGHYCPTCPPCPKRSMSDIEGEK